MPMPTETSQVKIDSDGRMYLNGREVSRDDLKREFERLGKVHGAVFFIDYSGSDFSQQQAQAVRKDMIDAHLPIRVK